jgi:UDP-3-O-[3-hydroxymyristoyl] N-acetylglucosamine deacetylase
MPGELLTTRGKQTSGHVFQQRTLARPVTLSGVGLHTGQVIGLTLLPAPVNHGVEVVRADLPGRPAIPARAEYVTDTALATTLGRGTARVSTVEHLLAAVAGLGVDNLRIEVDGPEVPIMDGSALPFAQAMVSAGLRAQGEAKSFLVIQRPVTVSEGDKHATFAPSRRFRIDCTIDFRHPLISDQQFCLEFSDRSFLKDVASARTFGFLRDVDRMRAQGLARGGSLENAVVVDDFSILNPEGLRFPDEFVRHKLLDALGDVALLGWPVLGALTVYKTGHGLNQKLVAKVLADPANFQVVRARQPDVHQHALELADLEGFLAPTAA